MLKLSIAPDIEPISLAEAKAHLRLDTDAEDDQLARLIQSARVHVEAFTGLALIAQVWTWTLGRWPPGPLALPLNPVAAIDRVRSATAAGVFTALDASALWLDADPVRPRLVPAGPLPAPSVSTDGIEIVFTAGFGPLPKDVPAPIRQALLLIVADWFDNRAPDPGAITRSDAVATLLAPWRRPLL